MMFEAVLSIAAVLCLVIIVFGCLDCLFKKKRFEAFGIRDGEHAQHNAAFSVDIFDADNISEQVIIEPLPDILSKVAVAPVLRPRITCTERGKQEATLSLLSVQRSFPRSRVTYLNEIGSGWFGKAIESEAIHIVTESDASRVVVKMLKDDASKSEQKQFMEEVNAFRCLEHANLLGFLGQCTETTPCLVILEFAAHGNLKSYLVQHRQEVDTLIASNRLVSFALGAASGLACLHRHDYIHNDLAARNCLVMSDYTLKIGDYGISDHLFKDEYFNTGRELLPVRWMAPDTLVQTDGVWTSHKCNKMSDMWSFGILLWEICSLGERPYGSLSDEAVLQSVVQDRQVLPSDVNSKLPFKIKMWSVMIQCWEEPSQRLHAEQAHHILEQLKTKSDIRATNSDFDQKWNYLEPNQGKRTDISLENTSTLANNSSIDFSLEKPSSFSHELDVLDGVKRDDVIIEIDNYLTAVPSRDHGKFSVPELLTQPVLTSAEDNLNTLQRNGSLSGTSYQLTLENELKRISIPLNHLRPTASLDQQVITGPLAVSKGSVTTSQFCSSHSSLSSEYMTVDETCDNTGIQEGTLRELSIADGDCSLDSEGMSIHESIEDTLKDSFSPCENSVVNNNNISTFILPFHEGEEDFSDYAHTSPETPEMNCRDFESAVPAAGDSLVQVKGVHEDELCNKDASILKTNVKSTDGFSCTDDMFSELVTYVDTITRVNNDRNEFANVSNSISPIDVNSISGNYNLSDYINSYDTVTNIVEKSSELSDLQAHREAEPLADSSQNVFISAKDHNSASSVLWVSGLEMENETSLDVNASPVSGLEMENETSIVKVNASPLSGLEMENETILDVNDSPVSGLEIENETRLDVNDSPVSGLEMANETSLDIVNASPVSGLEMENETSLDVNDSPVSGLEMENETSLDIVNASLVSGLEMENETSLVKVNESPVSGLEIENETSLVVNDSPVSGLEMENETSLDVNDSPVSGLEMENETSLVKVNASPLSGLEMENETILDVNDSPVSGLEMENETSLYIVNASPVSGLEMENETSLDVNDSPVSGLEMENETSLDVNDSPVSGLEMENETSLDIVNDSPVSGLEMENETSLVKVNESPVSGLEIENETSVVVNDSPVSGLEMENETSLDVNDSPVSGLEMENETSLVKGNASPVSGLEMENESSLDVNDSPVSGLEMENETSLVKGNASPVSGLEMENESSLDVNDSPVSGLEMENETSLDVNDSPVSVLEMENETSLVKVNASPLSGLEMENETILDVNDSPVSGLEIENETRLDVNDSPVSGLEMENETSLVKVNGSPVSGLEMENETSLDIINASPVQLSEELVGSNHSYNQSMEESQLACFSLPSNVSDSTFLGNSDNTETVQNVPLLQSEHFTDLQKHPETINKEELPHVGIVNDHDESITNLHLAIGDNAHAFSPSEFVDEQFYSEHSEFDEAASLMDGEEMVVQEEVSTSSKIESDSVDFNTHSPSLADGHTNHVTNSIEARLSMSYNDSSDYIEKAISSEAVIEEDDYEQDEVPSNFQSNLYRCSHISLTEDTENAAEALSNFKSVDVHGDHCREDSQSPVDSETEDAGNNNCESELGYISDEAISGLPQTSSPDNAVSNPDSASRVSPEPTSPIDFDEHALQIASEIYLSRGLKSPRVFENPPLETIPEHPPLSGFQEDSNYTPSDTSSMDVRYEEMFGGDSFEWDDFYGDSIGKDLSLHHTPHQHNSFVREYDVSDWSMDIDSESIASGTSIPSQTEETSIIVPTNLPSQSNISVDSENSMHLSFDSVLSPQSKSTDTSRETLVSSLLSQLQSPIVSSVSNANQNNFYSLTERYDLETDSSSDGLASPTAVRATTARSPSSFTNHVTPLSPPASPPFLSLLPLPSGQERSEQQNDVASPVSPDQSMSTSKSFSEESDISGGKSSLFLDPVNGLLGHDSEIVTAAGDIDAPIENTDSEEQQGSGDVIPVVNVLNSDVALDSNSTCVDKHNMIVNSKETHRDTGVIISAELTENSYIDL